MSRDSRAIPLIQMTDMVKTYHMGAVTINALNRVSLRVDAGEMLAIVGASGSGKSTLMSLIGLLDTADEGCYRLRGVDIASFNGDALARLRNQSIGFVFQQFHLLPRFNAVYNVALPLLYRNIPISDAVVRAQNTLDRVGMAAFFEHRPNQLSGGQQQRVAIARALVGDPEVLLADEPTGSLDSATSHDIMQLFLTLHREGRTVILVTHDEQIAARCTRSITLVDGRIVARSDT